VPPHSWPSTIPQLEGPLGAAAAQTPRDWPLAIVHEPVQHSPLAAQASPGWPQNDDAWQVPAEQSPEQHWPLPVHAFPIVEHEVLSGVHVPFAPHVWLQHCAPLAHGWLSD
jgi:hypothetical protein